MHEALKASQNKREVARLMALRPLFSIMEALISETHPERLVDLILNAICGHLRCEHAGFYRRGPVETRLDMVSFRGKPLQVPEEAGTENLLTRVDCRGLRW